MDDKKIWINSITKEIKYKPTDDVMNRTLIPLQFYKAASTGNTIGTLVSLNNSGLATLASATNLDRILGIVNKVQLVDAIDPDPDYEMLEIKDSGEYIFTGVVASLGDTLYYTSTGIVTTETVFSFETEDKVKLGIVKALSGSDPIVNLHIEVIAPVSGDVDFSTMETKTGLKQIDDAKLLVNIGNENFKMDPSEIFDLDNLIKIKSTLHPFVNKEGTNHRCYNSNNRFFITELDGTIMPGFNVDYIRGESINGIHWNPFSTKAVYNYFYNSKYKKFIGNIIVGSGESTDNRGLFITQDEFSTTSSPLAIPSSLKSGATLQYGGWLRLGDEIYRLETYSTSPYDTNIYFYKPNNLEGPTASISLITDWTECGYITKASNFINIDVIRQGSSSFCDQFLRGVVLPDNSIVIINNHTSGTDENKKILKFPAEFGTGDITAQVESLSLDTIRLGTPSLDYVYSLNDVFEFKGNYYISFEGDIDMTYGMFGLLEISSSNIISGFSTGTNWTRILKDGATMGPYIIDSMLKNDNMVIFYSSASANIYEFGFKNSTDGIKELGDPALRYGKYIQKCGDHFIILTRDTYPNDLSYLKYFDDLPIVEGRFDFDYANMTTVADLRFIQNVSNSYQIFALPTLNQTTNNINSRSHYSLFSGTDAVTGPTYAKAITITVDSRLINLIESGRIYKDYYFKNQNLVDIDIYETLPAREYNLKIDNHKNIEVNCYATSPTVSGVVDNIVLNTLTLPVSFTNIPAHINPIIVGTLNELPAVDMNLFLTASTNLINGKIVSYAGGDLGDGNSFKYSFTAKGKLSGDILYNGSSYEQ